jgi:hypothetical protein
VSIADPLQTPDRFAVIGDIHEDWGFGSRALTYAADRGATVALQVGDFGFWQPDSAFLAGMSAAACHRGVPLLWVDGNHENHHALARLPIDPATGLRPVAPGIWHLPRGFAWTWGSLRFRALGGAHSVNRRGLTPGMDWFPEETLSRADVDHVLAAGAADVMITHDAPAGVTIPGLRSHEWPQADIRSADAHREVLRTVADQLRPRWWFHGHYHQRYADALVGAGYRCAVLGLGHNHSAVLAHAVHVQPLRLLAAPTDPPGPLTTAGSGRRTARSR